MEEFAFSTDRTEFEKPNFPLMARCSNSDGSSQKRETSSREKVRRKKIKNGSKAREKVQWKSTRANGTTAMNERQCARIYSKNTFKAY